MEEWWRKKGSKGEGSSVWLAIPRMLEGQSEEPLTILKTDLEHQPLGNPTRMLMGEVLRTRGDSAGAIQTLERVLQQGPRQPFCSSEIGLYKAVVMVSRLNLFWGLNWAAVPEYMTSPTDLSNFDIVIGGVDTCAARQLIHDKVQGMRSRVAYWLDLGNSADSGQFVMGQPLNSRNRRSAQRLPTAPELFPEIIEASLDNDGAPSCSAIEALERQEPFVNQAWRSMRWRC